MTILLIEPDKLLAKTIQDYLRSFHVIWVSNGHQAVEVMEELNVDAIVSEHQFAAHNSFEFLYELRSYSDWQNVPYILFTQSYISDAVMEGEVFSRLGITKYMYKPKSTLADLAKVLDSLKIHATS